MTLETYNAMISYLDMMIALVFRLSPCAQLA